MPQPDHVSIYDLPNVEDLDDDMQRYFEVTAPSVHRMVLELERKNLISRTPRTARSIKLLIPPEQLPMLK